MKAITIKATTTNTIFDHARLGLRSAFVQRLIPLMVFLAPATEGAEPREPLDIPLQTVVKTVESTERTPWGEALAKTTYGVDEKESTVHFTRFALASKSRPDAKNLGNAVENFKNNYKCTAKKSKRTFKFDPSCEVSAQLAWEGLCASGGRYLNVQFIAREHLYEIGATRSMMQIERNLAQVVADLAGRCRGGQNEKSR